MSSADLVPSPLTRIGQCFACGGPVEQTRVLDDPPMYLPRHCSQACDRQTESRAEARTAFFERAREEHNLRNALAASNVRAEIAAGELELDALPRLYAEARKVGGVEPERYSEIVGVIRDFVKVPPLLRGAGVVTILYIHGSRGLGKTWLLEAAVGYMIKHLKRAATFTSHENICAEVKRSYSSAPEDRDAVEVRIVEGFAEVPLLAIDDVGRKTSPTEWELNLLLRIVDERYRNSRPVLVSSNYSVKALFELWSDANDTRKTKLVELLCDRLADAKRAISICMKGTSLRREA